MYVDNIIATNSCVLLNLPVRVSFREKLTKLNHSVSFHNTLTKMSQHETKNHSQENKTNARNKKSMAANESKVEENVSQETWDEIYEETKTMMVNYVPEIQQAVLECATGADTADEMSRVLQTMVLLHNDLAELIKKHEVFKYFSN